MQNFIRTTLDPAIYHGRGRQAPFFEGWYYKLISADEAHRYAIIPGVILGSDGHAFVQVLNGTTGQAAYHRYPLGQFWASQGRFQVQIGPNSFTWDQVLLQIDREEGQIAGRVGFRGLAPWPVSVPAPGIMGWYAWVPRMECYHGVLSMDHTIQGALQVDGRLLDFSGGRGYIEKDWGQSFPAAWIWFQSNHFQQPGSSITASIAIIPWVRQAFPGFIIGFWHRQTLYRFATYTGAQIEQLEITDDHVTWVVRNRRHRLHMRATRAEGGLILGPTRQDMTKRVNETLKATVGVQLTTLGGHELFSGQGRHAGLEVHGDLERLLALQR